MTNLHSAQSKSQKAGGAFSHQQLPDIFEPHSDLLNDIANVWLTSGAAHVAIWGEGKVYANWAQKKSSISESQPTYTQLSASIRLNGEVIGHLYIFGQNDRISKKRLKLDAALISAKIQLDHSAANPPVSVPEPADIEDESLSFKTLAEKSERSLLEVQQKFDALVRLHEYDQMEDEQSLEAWLTFSAKR